MRIFRISYKVAAVLLLAYALLRGLTANLPRVADLGHTSRNLFYHVPMWFSMYLMMVLSLVFSIKALRSRSANDDLWAQQFARIGVFFGVCGLLTGIVWSRVTWGFSLPANNMSAWWPWDPKQSMALVSILIYLAYFVLRSAVEDEQARMRLAAVYNIFAAASIAPLTYIVPRTLQSLHPGGQSAAPLFDGAIAAEYRLIFYPAVVGFMCLGLWLVELRVRTGRLNRLVAERAANA